MVSMADLIGPFCLAEIDSCSTVVRNVGSVAVLEIILYLGVDLL
jgi:hypothetical protein